MKQLRILGRSARAARVATIGVVLATAVLTMAAVVGAGWLGWSFGLPVKDRGVVLGVIAALAACILTLLGTGVALMAFLAATGEPDLDVSVYFPFSFPNRPAFLVEGRHLVPFKQLSGEVRVTNRSKHGARNPGVRIEFDGVLGLSEQPGWTLVEWINTVGPVSFQWDGGVNGIVHGKWSRKLPPLNLDGAHTLPSDVALIVTVVADGVEPRTRRMPILVLKQEEYDAYQKLRSERLEEERAGNSVRKGPSLAVRVCRLGRPRSPMTFGAITPPKD